MYDSFCLERWQSLHDFAAKYNLSESGVEPLELSELQSVPSTTLGYGHTKGSPELRRELAVIYKNRKEEDILITNGGAEANFVAVNSAIQPGDEVAVQMPNYMQVVGLLKSLGAKCRYFWLRGPNFEFDRDELRKQVTAKTKAVFITNPNNPAGTVLDESDVRFIADIAGENDALLFSDEVYRGLEIQARTAPSAADLYERSIVTSSLSKVYGLPGIRIGWLTASRDLVDKAWAIKDYTTISPSVVSQLIAVQALRVRESLESRARMIAQRNLRVAREILEKTDDFEWRTPEAAPFVFIRTTFTDDNYTFCERLFEETGVLINPGRCFEMPSYVRIGLGVKDDGWLIRALDELTRFTRRYRDG